MPDRSNFDHGTFFARSDLTVPRAVGTWFFFSATGALEGQHFTQTRELVPLSAQNLIDCSGHFGNTGCEGGTMDFGFQYIKVNGGIDTEKSYPYEARDGNCRFNRATIGANATVI